MYAKNKAQSDCDVKVAIDKGSIRLSFPKRHTPLWELMDGKSLKGKPKYLYLGKAGFSGDNSDDCKRAAQIAIAMEADLDHPEWDKLFDRTLEKYGLAGLLGGKYAKLADVLQMPGTVAAIPEITVGEMWEAYLEWKRTVIEETTFKHTYSNLYTHTLSGLIWDRKKCHHVQSSSTLIDIKLDASQVIKDFLTNASISSKNGFVFALNEAFNFCKSKGMLVNPTTQNPFVLDKYSATTVTTQQKYASKIINGEEKQWHEVTDEKAFEADRRAFTKAERDIIIKAFYESVKEANRYVAPLFEFYFLTGCRTSEALPLTWSDVDFLRGVIRFNKSLGSNTGKIKETKTGEARLFYFGKNSRLRELLLKLKNESTAELLFPGKRNKYMSVQTIAKTWRGYFYTKILVDSTEKAYHYPGVVTQLVEEGAISGYLSPYHTRHTYITLTAHANAHNNNALLHIATSCGNSVDVILRHYLGVAESVELVEA